MELEFHLYLVDRFELFPYAIDVYAIPASLGVYTSRMLTGLSELEEFLEYAWEMHGKR